jgi:hypothetical protein
VPGPIPLGDIGKLNHELTDITPRSLRASLIMSAVFAAFALLLGVSSTLQRSTQELKPWVSEIIRSVCCTICVTPLLTLTVVLYRLRARAKLPKEVSLETSRTS